MIHRSSTSSRSWSVECEHISYRYEYILVLVLLSIEKVNRSWKKKRRRRPSGRIRKMFFHPKGKQSMRSLVTEYKPRSRIIHTFQVHLVVWNKHVRSAVDVKKSTEGLSCTSRSTRNGNYSSSTAVMLGTFTYFEAGTSIQQFLFIYPEGSSLRPVAFLVCLPGAYHTWNIF